MRPATTEACPVSGQSDYWGQLRVRVTASRAAQGLPPTVTDRRVLEHVAAVVRTAASESRHVQRGVCP